MAIKLVKNADSLEILNDGNTIYSYNLTLGSIQVRGKDPTVRPLNASQYCTITQCYECTTVDCTTINCTTINCTTINCTTINCTTIQCSGHCTQNCLNCGNCSNCLSGKCDFCDYESYRCTNCYNCYNCVNYT